MLEKSWRTPGQKELVNNPLGHFYASKHEDS